MSLVVVVLKLLAGLSLTREITLHCQLELLILLEDLFIHIFHCYLI